jgi:hypothetical protein
MRIGTRLYGRLTPEQVEGILEQERAEEAS